MHGVLGTVRSHGGSDFAGGEPSQAGVQAGPAGHTPSDETDRSNGLQSALPLKSNNRKDRLFHCRCWYLYELLTTETAVRSETHVRLSETPVSHVAFGRKQAMGSDFAPLQAEGLGRLSLKVSKVIPAAQRETRAISGGRGGYCDSSHKDRVGGLSWDPARP